MATQIDPTTGLPYDDSSGPGGTPGVAPSGPPAVTPTTLGSLTGTPGTPGLTGPGTVTGGTGAPTTTAPSGVLTATNNQPLSPNWGNYSGDPNDPNAINQYIAYLSGLPDADPTLASDPGYWANVISGQGGLTAANIGYFSGGRYKAGAGDASGTAGQQTLGSFTQPPNFTAPTAQDLMNSPGYTARLNAADLGLENSAAARGDLLTGGFQKSLGQFNQDYASNEYQNLFNQDLQANTTNFGQDLTSNSQNFGQLFSTAQLGLGAAEAQAGLGASFGQTAAGTITGIGNAGAAGTIGAGNATAGGLSNAGNSLAAYYALMNGGF